MRVYRVYIDSKNLCNHHPLMSSTIFIAQKVIIDGSVGGGSEKGGWKFTHFTSPGSAPVNVENERFTVVCSRCPTLKISCCHLADYVRKLYWSAYRTCSTIIFRHSANQIIVFWRRRYLCCRSCVSSLLLKTELSISDLQHFHSLAGHRLPVHLPAVPNTVKECVSKKASSKQFCSS